MVACKLLVVWKVCWWPHWSTLAYPEFQVLDLADPNSFDQYSFPALQHSRWDEPVWQPAWTQAYSAYFPFHVCAVAGEAANVPCLYSLALRSLFVWFRALVKILCMTLNVTSLWTTRVFVKVVQRVSGLVSPLTTFVALQGPVGHSLFPSISLGSSRLPV